MSDRDAEQLEARRSGQRDKDRSGAVPGKLANTDNYGEGGPEVTPRIPGKSSGTEHLPPSTIAREGTASAPGKLPHLERIQASFGDHNITNVGAHVGGPAATSAKKLGARAYAQGNAVAFAGEPDLHTAAHEAAHVVQQRRGLTLHGGIDGGAGDPFEREADAVADAVVAGQSAQPLLGDPKEATAPASDAAVQRKEENEGDKPVDVRKWITEHASELKAKVTAKLGNVAFATESPFATWLGPAAPIGQQIAGCFTFDDASLSRVLYGEDYRGGVVRAANPEPSLDSAADALVASLTTQIAASLRRVMPAYAVAVNQSAWRYESTVLKREMGPGDGPPPQPPIAQVPVAHPMDMHVRAVLTGWSNVAIDFRRLRTAVPGENKPYDIAVTRIIPPNRITLLDAKGKWNWVVVGNFDDPKPAEVAKALFGKEEHAAYITPAAPQFGFDPAGGLIEPFKTQYEAKARPFTPTNPEELDPKSASPAGQLANSTLTDQTSLQQSATLAGTNATQDAVRERMSLIVSVLDECISMAKALKMESDLTGVKKRVEDRIKQLSQNSTQNQAELPSWDAESAFQLATLSKASKALKLAQIQARSAKGSGGGKDGKPNPQAQAATALLMGPAIQLGRAWADVIGLSDLPESCKPKLAEAEKRAKLFPVEVGETLLNYVRELILQTKASGAAANVIYNSDGTAKKEAELRKKLVEMRSTFETDPVKGQLLLGEIQDEIDSLLLEANLGNTVMQLVYLTEQLKEHKDSWLEGAIDWATYSKDDESPKKRRTNKDRIKDTLDYMEIFSERVRNQIEAPFSKGTKEGLTQAKAAFESFQGDDVIKEKLEFAKAVIEDAEFIHAVTAIGAMLLIGLASGGLGDLVVAEEVGFVASTATVAGVTVSTATVGAAVVESLTVSTITTLMSKDPTVGHFAVEFLTNFAFAGVFKTVGANIQKLQAAGKLTAEEGKLANAASFGAMYTGLVATRCVELDHEKKAKGQPGITEEEVLETAAHTAAELIGQAIAAHAVHQFGGKIAAKIENMREVTEIQRMRDSVRAEAEALTAMAQNTPAKTLNPKIREVAASSSEELKAEEAFLRKLDQAMNSPEGAHLFSREEFESIRSMLGETSKQLYFQRKAALVTGSPEVAPGHYEIDAGSLADVIAKVKEMGGWRQMEITGNHGEQTVRFEPNLEGPMEPPEPGVRFLKFTEVSKGAAKAPEEIPVEAWKHTVQSIRAGSAPPANGMKATAMNLQAQRKLDMLMQDPHLTAGDGRRLRNDFMKQLAASLDETKPEEDLNKIIMDILTSAQEGGKPKYLRRGPALGSAEVSRLGGLKRAVTFDTAIGTRLITRDYYQRIVAGHEAETWADYSQISFNEPAKMKKVMELMRQDPPLPHDFNYGAIISSRGQAAWWYAGADEGGASSAAALGKALAQSSMADGVIVFELPADVVTGARDATLDGAGTTGRVAATKPTAFDGMLVGWSQFNPNPDIGAPTGLTTPEPGVAQPPVREVMVPPVAIKSCKFPCTIMTQ